MDEKKRAIVEKIAQVLGAFEEIDFGYIFGSFASSDDFEDIDVGIGMSTDCESYRQLKLSSQLAAELERNIKPRHEFDVKVFSQCPISFQYTVIRTGKVVFCRDRVKLVRYEAAVLSDYLDYEETSHWLDKQFLARIASGS